MTYHSRRNFSLLSLGQFVSMAGDKISTAVFFSIAVGIVASSQTTYQSSIVVVFQTLPYLIFGYLFGLMADLVEKRKVLIGADIARVLVLVSLFFYHDSLLFLYFCVFLIGTFSAMFNPAKKSIMPFLVSRDRLVFFNKFFALTEIAAMGVGLLFGTFLLSWMGIERALLLDASTYVFSTLLLLFLSYRDEDLKLKGEKKKTFRAEFNRYLRELGEGWSYLKKNEDVKVVIWSLMFFNFLAIAVFSASLVDFSIRMFDLGQDFLRGYGFGNILVGSHTTFVFLFVAFGAMLSPLGKMIFRNSKESNLSIGIFGVGALSVFVLVACSWFISLEVFYPFFLLFMIPMGIFVGMQYIRISYLIQLNCDKEFMGRVVSLSEITWSVAFFFGMLFGTWVNEIFTWKVGLLIGGLIYLCGGIWLWSRRKDISW